MSPLFNIMKMLKKIYLVLCRAMLRIGRNVLKFQFCLKFEVKAGLDIDKTNGEVTGVKNRGIEEKELLDSDAD